MQHKSEYRRDSPEKGNGQQCKKFCRRTENDRNKNNSKKIDMIGNSLIVQWLRPPQRYE